MTLKEFASEYFEADKKLIFQFGKANIEIDEPENIAADDKIIVFFLKSLKLKSKILQDYCSIISQKKVENALIIGENKITN